MAETSSLLRNHTYYGYRGFESLRLRQIQALPHQRGIVDLPTHDQSPHANFCALRLSYKTSDQCESAEDVESSVELNTPNSDLEPQTLKAWDLQVFWRCFECVGRRFAESPVIASKKSRSDPSSRLIHSLMDRRKIVA